MALISKPNTFSAGATIIASEHNSNFDTIYNDYNGNITNANLSGTAGITDANLAQITTASKVSWTAVTGFTIDGSIQFMVDGGGSVITTGTKGIMTIPFACTLTGWTMLSDISCTATMDVNRQTYANYDAAPTSIVGGSSVPTITTAVKGQDLDIANWTSVAIAAGDVLEFDVDTNNFAQILTLSLNYTR